MRKEKDFLYAKIRDIDHITDIYRKQEIGTKELIGKIRSIITMASDKRRVIKEDGEVLIEVSS